MEDEFKAVKEHLEKLSTTNEKIKYLIDRKTEYLQNKSLIDDDLVTPFDKKCDLEINRLREHQKLEGSQNNSSAIQSPFIKAFREERAKRSAKNLVNNFQQSENDKKCERELNQKELGLTLDRATLFIDYLFKYAKIDCKNTDKAKIIAFLTGYSEQKIAQAFSRLEKEKNDFTDKESSSEKFSNDIEIVRKYFKILKSDEIQKVIDDDLELDFD